MSKSGHLLPLIVVATLAASSASAHITLQSGRATIGTDYRAVLSVPHGCAGSPTVKLRVQIPEGVIAVKPVPTEGWKVDVVNGKYATGYDYQGARVSEGAKEVVWSGGKLGRFLEEALVDRLTAPGAFVLGVFVRLINWIEPISIFSASCLAQIHGFT